jgi:hypothetical protein
MINHPPAWTHQDDLLLRKLAASGTTVEEIARRLSRSPSAIRSVLQIRLAGSGYIRLMKAKSK